MTKEELTKALEKAQAENAMLKADNDKLAQLKNSTTNTAIAQDPNQALPQEVAQRFEIMDWWGGHRQNFGKFGIVDLSTMTVAQAQRLVNMGFTKIKPKN